jgi:hypothetical protein
MSAIKKKLFTASSAKWVAFCFSFSGNLSNGSSEGSIAYTWGSKGQIHIGYLMHFLPIVGSKGNYELVWMFDEPGR